MADGGMEARATGLYSLISLQPLRTLSSTGAPGQPLTARHAAWLRDHGLWANLAELTTLKSDDVDNRAALGDALEGKGPFPHPGVPQSLWTLQCALRVVGFNVEIRKHPRHVALMLRPGTDADAQALSHGRIRKPETVNYRTELPEREGLFCPIVFGESESELRQRMGHLELSFPIVPYIWRAGKPSLLAQLTGLDERELRNVIDGNGGDFGSWPEAVAERVRMKGHAAFVDAVARRTVLMYPAAMRPLVKLESGNWATSDVNDLYRRLINRSNRLRKLVELKAPEIIIVNERQQLQSAADNLLANCMLSNSDAEHQGHGGERRRLVDILHLALDVLETSSKRVEYAGRAVTVVDDSLAADVVRIPYYIMTTVGLGPSAVLLARPEGEPNTFAAARPQATSDMAIGVPPQIAKALALTEGSAIIVHRPLSPAAIAETEQLARQPMGEVAEPTLVAGRPSDDVVVEQLVNCATNGIELELNDPRGLLIGGAGETSLV